MTDRAEFGSLQSGCELSSRYQCPNCQRADGLKNEYKGQGQRPTEKRASCKYCSYILRSERL